MDPRTIFRWVLAGVFLVLALGAVGMNALWALWPLPANKKRPSTVPLVAPILACMAGVAAPQTGSMLVPVIIALIDPATWRLSSRPTPK